MIVLLNCSTSWCQNSVNDSLSSTGVVVQTDSLVSIPVSVLKQANAKLIELKYEKEINNELRQVIINDSVIIKGLKQNTDFYKALAESKAKEAKKYRRQRNLFGCIGLLASVCAIVFAVK